MAKINRPRFGSLQFYPRKRVEKALPRVNWSSVKGGKDAGILGFISYKVGMGTAIVKDNTKDSMTKGKKIAVPVTILEMPKMKIYSVRFYKHGQVMKEVIVSNDKELKRIVTVPKQVNHALESVQGWDDIRVIVYSVMKDMFKKTPDIAEVGIEGANKLEVVKSLIGKELTGKEIVKWGLTDVRGLTTGRGLVGPVKRFGISLKQHKSEKGIRRPGSLGPWHPARVTFRVPMAGQLGMFTRVHYNLKVIKTAGHEEKISKPEGFKNYGMVRHDYIVVVGSVQGPAKRQILLTPAMRPNKKQTKKTYELVELKL